MTTSLEADGVAVARSPTSVQDAYTLLEFGRLINAWHRPFFQCASKRTGGRPPRAVAKACEGGMVQKKEGAHRPGAAAPQFCHNLP